MEIYRDHEKEFSKYLSLANKKLNQFMTEEDSDGLLIEVKSCIDDAEKLINILENDLRGMGGQESSQFKKRFDNSKENLQKLKNSYAPARDKKEKQNLIGSQDRYKRDKMLSNNELVQQTGDILESTNRLAAETEVIGYTALNDLKGQRKVINNIGEKVNDVGINVTKANRVISVMNKRRIVMKLMMMATIVLLTIAFAICLYIKLG
jgi:Snare region anchored in the vesicle membrane C-terminus/Vesicle transport v-SNARE protein N-terminus